MVDTDTAKLPSLPAATTTTTFRWLFARRRLPTASGGVADGDGDAASAAAGGGSPPLRHNGNETFNLHLHTQRATINPVGQRTQDSPDDAARRVQVTVEEIAKMSTGRQGEVGHVRGGDETRVSHQLGAKRRHAHTGRLTMRVLTVPT